jgi:hypothetical protein
MEVLQEALLLEKRRQANSSTPTIMTRKERKDTTPILVTSANFRGKSHESHFCEVIHTAVRYGWTIHLLGWGKISLWGPKHAKIGNTLSFLKRLPPDQLVLFIDAFDVLLAGGPEEAKRKFLQASEEVSNSDIIVSTETKCWPFFLDEKWKDHVCQEHYPHPPTLTAETHRWLNSGSWMGYADAAIKLLEGLKTISKIPGLLFSHDDQALLHYAFLSGLYSVGLDYNQTIFQSMNAYREDLVFDKSQQRWKNQRFNEYPITMHFNGGGKRHFLDYGDPLYGEENKGAISDYSNVTGKVLNGIHGFNFNRVCKRGWPV